MVLYKACTIIHVLLHKCFMLVLENLNKNNFQNYLELFPILPGNIVLIIISKT
jgi:hypothetical protein